ncbi:hypothetical protein BV898_11629 [Hypsibius exemplaris]|uniref:Uncharacterized protein n=1 Tax=Hypsibius exemplaris TaxID=2072580 RepID=A0A1W0WG36_HYPEX|nr:hypothetical protein BV898_11629 [Hypsibius exemplaris]
MPAPSVGPPAPALGPPAPSVGPPAPSVGPPAPSVGPSVANRGRKEEWAKVVNRLYPYANREPLYQYVKPGNSLTQAERNLNRGALTAKWDFIEKVLPGGGETKYITHPEVALQNWWERCVVEKPGFVTSLGRRLPDNLTKCSEYREEISEYAHFFKEHSDEDIRGSPSHASKKVIPMAVKMYHRSEFSPLSNYQFGWADEKRKKWIAESVDESVAYCTDYQRHYNPVIYERQALEARNASLCPYIGNEDLWKKEVKNPRILL